jgi:hypothetical protein
MVVRSSHHSFQRCAASSDHDGHGLAAFAHPTDPENIVGALCKRDGFIGTDEVDRALGTLLQVLL